MKHLRLLCDNDQCRQFIDQRQKEDWRVAFLDIPPFTIASKLYNVEGTALDFVPVSFLDFVFGMLINSLALAVALATLVWGRTRWKDLPLMLLIAVCVAVWSTLRIVNWYYLRFGQTGMLWTRNFAQWRQVGSIFILTTAIECVVYLLEYVAMSGMIFHWGVVFLDALKLGKFHPVLKWSLIVLNVATMIGTFVTIGVLSGRFLQASLFSQDTMSSDLFTYLDMLSRVMCGGSLMLATLLCASCIGGIVLLYRGGAGHHVIAVVKSLVLFVILLVGMVFNALLVFSNKIFFLDMGLVVSFGMTVSQFIVVVRFSCWSLAQCTPMARERI